jgi:DNA-binding NarL/FixJ family response regulator
VNPSPFEFLVIDDNSDSRFLLVKTLERKFTGAIVHECQQSEMALHKIKNADLAAIICHRTTETPGIELLHEIRALRPTLPLVMVSGIDRRQQALAAGADRFLLYDEWLRIGTVVEEVIAERSAAPNRQLQHR